MDYTASARTNYVVVEDVDGLKKALNDWPISIATDKVDGKVALLARGNNGWPAWGLSKEGDEISLDVGAQIMPFVNEGQVLVLMEIGHEGTKYVSGSACAWIRRGTEISELNLALANIYQMAADTFSVPVADITAAEH